MGNIILILHPMNDLLFTRTHYEFHVTIINVYSCMMCIRDKTPFFRINLELLLNESSCYCIELNVYLR